MEEWMSSGRLSNCFSVSVMVSWPDTLKGKQSVTEKMSTAQVSTDHVITKCFQKYTSLVCSQWKKHSLPQKHSLQAIKCYHLISDR